MQDKEKDFLDSNQWIGAFEVSLAINYFTDGFDCKILNIAQGSLLSEQGPTLREHFLTHGTPVMIGGDIYAHTILGVDVRIDDSEVIDETKPKVMFLILDPHYKGADGNLKQMLSKGWCAWKDPTKFFNQNTFYNLCMPLIPS